MSGEWYGKLGGSVGAQNGNGIPDVDVLPFRKTLFTDGTVKDLEITLEAPSNSRRKGNQSRSENYTIVKSDPQSMEFFVIGHKVQSSRRKGFLTFFCNSHLVILFGPKEDKALLGG